MPDIFISYRREDAVAHAGRLYDRLASHFGSNHVFMDIDTIKPGEDFVELLEKAVGSCDVLIALIGRHWALAVDENGRRRIDVPEDFLRREIEIALRHNVRVIPVLLQGAVMPSADELPEAISSLARRHAFNLPDAGFHRAVDELMTLVTSISTDVKSPRAKKVQAESPGDVMTPRSGVVGFHLPDSKIRRMFLLYRPPKAYGWFLRFYFIWCVLAGPIFGIVSVSFGITGGLDSGDAVGLAIAAVAAVPLALALRSLTVRLERKFQTSKQT